MKAIILMMLLMVPIASAITIETIEEITIVYDLHPADPYDNIYSLYCDDVGSVCNVYRTDVRHTTLVGK